MLAIGERKKKGGGEYWAESDGNEMRIQLVLDRAIKGNMMVIFPQGTAHKLYTIARNFIASVETRRHRNLHTVLQFISFNTNTMFQG